jgi:hypothetical protein
VLRIDINLELGNAKRLRLRASGALEEIVHEDHGGQSRFGEENPVAHGVFDFDDTRCDARRSRSFVT